MTQFNVTSRLVVLDVRVIDQHGKFVPDLDRNAFSVFEDGAPQKILSFEKPEDQSGFVTSDKLVVSSTSDLVKIGIAPVNVLVIDELNTPFTEMARVRQALHRCLERQPRVLAVPTLLLGSGVSGITVLHDFTQSRSDLLASITMHVSDLDFRMLHDQLNGGSLGAEEGFAKTLGALSQVAGSLMGIPGHKNVIWIGTGFDNSYDLVSASQFDQDKIASVVQLVTERMLNARMTLSTLDPTGLNALAPTEEVAGEIPSGSGGSALDQSVQNVSFDKLAQTTGGAVIHGRNDLDKLISQSAEEATQFYTLAYGPTNHSDDPTAFRHIRVVMRNPSLHALTRTGYFSATDAESVAPVDVELGASREFRYDLTSAGSSRLVYTGLHITVQPYERGYKLLVLASDLHWADATDSSRIAQVALLAVAFDQKGKVLLQQAIEAKEQIRRTDVTSDAKVPFTLTLTAPTKASRIRFVVKDTATGKMGSCELLRSAKSRE